MNGYKVTIERIRDGAPTETGYVREESETIFEQRVEVLDVRGVVLVVNSLAITVETHK